MVPNPRSESQEPGCASLCLSQRDEPAFKALSSPATESSLDVRRSATIEYSFVRASICIVDRTARSICRREIAMRRYSSAGIEA